MKSTQTEAKIKVYVEEKILVVVMMVASLCLAAGLVGGLFIQESEAPKLIEPQAITIAPKTVEVQFSKHLQNAVSYDFLISDEGELSYMAEPGNPAVPYQLVNFLVPQGEVISDVKVTLGTLQEFNNINIQPAQNLIPKFISDPARAEEIILEQFGSLENVPDYWKRDESFIDTDLFKRVLPNRSVYLKDDLFPGYYYQQGISQYKKGYEIITFQVFPYQYKPKSKTFLYYSELALTITTEKDSTKQPSFLLKTSVTDKNEIRNLISNDQTIETYTETVDSITKTNDSLFIKTAYAQSSFVKPSDSPELDYEYLIITDPIFESTFQTLLNHKQNRSENSISSGIIITTDDIADNYNHDTYDSTIYPPTGLSPSKVRNFIIDTYLNWKPAGKEQFILLGGDVEYVPHRGMYGSAGFETDNYIPADLYYMGLDGTWDTDGNGIYGKFSNEEDLLAEVYVGRAPVGSISEANNFINKVIYYENTATEGFVANALFIGETLDESTEGGNAKDTITEDDFGSRWTLARLYEMNSNFSSGAVASYINQNNTGLLNHDGHGNYGDLIGLEPIDFTNTNPFLLTTVACNAGGFDCPGGSGCTISNDSIAERYLVGSHGPFALITNSRYGWYIGGQPFGPSQKYDHNFFIALNDNTIASNLGYLLQYAKELDPSSISAEGWIYYAWNLLGDPETPIKRNFLTPRANLRRIPDDTGDPYNYNFPVRGETEIIGTASSGLASGADFDHYELWYGSGNQPLAWMDEAVSYTGLDQYQEVIDDKLGTLDARQIPIDGMYTLKIDVYDTLGRVTTHSFTINNIQASGSVMNLSTDVLDFGNVIVGNSSILSFDIFNNGRDDLTLEILPITNTDFTTAAGTFTVTPDNSMTVEVAYSPSDRWSLDEDILIITSNDPVYPQVEISLVGYPEDYYLTGWPQHVGGFIKSINTADFDLDGLSEVVIANDEGVISVYNSDGTAYQDFSTQQVAWMWGNNYITTGDLNGDSYPEIVAVSNDQNVGEVYIHVWDRFGNSLSANWPKVLPITTNDSTAVISDLNSDGFGEVILALNEFSATPTVHLYVWDYLGSNFDSVWPKQLPAQSSSIPTVGDINADGNKEIIINTIISWNPLQTDLFVYSSEGQLELTITNDSEMHWEVNPILVDINNDMYYEFLVPYSDRLALYDQSGNLLPGWPVTVGFLQALITADINSDGAIEILYQYDDKLTVRRANDADGDGTADLLSEWSIGTFSPSYPTAVNLDTDTELEIVIAKRYENEVVIYHNDGSVARILPIQSPLEYTLLVEDLNQSASLENIIVASESGTVYIWNTEYSPVQSVQWERSLFDRNRTSYVTQEFFCLDGTKVGFCNNSDKLCTINGLKSCDDGDRCTIDTCPIGGSSCVNEQVPNDCGTKECGRSSDFCYVCGICPTEQPYCNPDGLCEAKCSDGTPFGECNDFQWYCEEGQLIARCDLCGRGCFDDYQCISSKCCKKVNGQYQCIGDTPYVQEEIDQQILR